jgi:hypothetical protein
MVHWVCSEHIVMGKKFYMKEGVGFEGISMMEETKSKIPRIMIVTGAVIIGIALLGFGASKFLTANQTSATPTPGVTILPTSSRNAEPTEDNAPTVAATVLPTQRQSSSPTPSRKPSPTVTGTTTTKQLSVAVLNGSGTKGAAGGMASDLAAAGYSVVRTGNANSFGYTGISIDIKKSKNKSLDQLKKDLSANGYLVTNTTATLAESDTADAVIIVGAEE